METLNHRSYLLRISEDITKEQLEEMKYLCMDCISEGKLETITSPLQLFKELERLKKMDIDNLSFLRELLENVRCLELAGRVNDLNLRRELELLFLKEQRKEPRYRQDFNDTAIECLVMEESREDQLLNHTGALKKKALGGRQVDEEKFRLQKRCPCVVHCRPNRREPGEISLHIVVKLASKGVWFAGTFYILKRYINDPVTLAGLFASVVLPSGVLIKYLCEGSIICVLEANYLPGLQELWQNYQSGKLLEALKDILITEELKALADGQEITMSVTLDENIYREACLELMVAKLKVNQTFSKVQQRPRSSSDPQTDFFQKPRTTSQEKSFQILAEVERSRRKRAEQKLETMLAVQSLDLLDFSPFTGKKGQETDSDEISSMASSTTDEDQLLDHEEANNGLSDFWLPIKGGPKEKSWNDFESAVKETCSEYLQLGGIALLKFLMYVLMVEYDKREYATVYRHNFIRLSVWFGSPNEGMQGCLKKMLHLMTKSVSVDADGTRTSWFAGYTTEKEAKRLLQSEKSGAFLVRFKCHGQPGFLLTKKSRNGLSIVEYPIEVLGDTGKLSFNDRDFPDLPSLVTELQKSWMTDLQPFYSVEGF